MITSSPGPTVAASALWIECFAPLERITCSGATSKPWKDLYQAATAFFTSGRPLDGV